jgi:hypothetical protein
MNKGVSEQPNTAAWSVRGLYSKENELEKLLRSYTDVAIISATNKKLKGSKELQDHLLYYSGVPQEKRAFSEIAILINKKYKHRNHSYTFVNEE